MSSTSQWAGMPPSGTATAPMGTGSGDPAAYNSNSGGAPNTSLYLYTFLATLVVLLSVSSCIIVRSFALRARRRREVAAMLSADPTLLPPGWVNGRYHAHPRKPEIAQPTPTLWEIHVPSREKTEGSSLRWPDMRPISALRPAPNAPDSTSTATPSASIPSRNLLRRYFFPPPPISTPPASTPPVDSPPAVPDASLSSPKGAYAVSVIIAMPDAGRTNLKPYEEDAPAPYVEIGVADLRIPKLGAEATADA